MANDEQLDLGGAWEPGRLGRSIPLAAGMRRSRLAGLGVAVLALAVASGGVYRLLRPAGLALSADETRRVVYDRLERLTLPPWTPGGELPPIALPDAHPTPPPPPWPGAHPGDAPLPAEARQRLDGSLRLLEEDALAAAGRLRRLVRQRPGHWGSRYNLGVSLLRAGLWDDAVEHLDEALLRLRGLEEPYGARPEHQAAVIHNRYALGHALLANGRCVQAIRTIKFGIRALRGFLEAGELEVYGRYLPFTVAPTSLDSYSTWLLLARAYAECKGRYPAEYFRDHPDAKDFRAAEYADPDTAEIRDGPFPNELAACIADNGETSRCWALSNLNLIYFASRQAYPRRGVEPSAGLEPLWPRMAAIAYEIARLAAEREPDRRGAATYLQQARILNRSGADATLDQRIDQLGRYLAREIRDFTLLADPYRGTAIAALPFAGADSAEEIKGMAWVLKERCEGHLRERNPAGISADVDRVRQTLAASEHLASLDRWQKQVTKTLRQRLLEAMATERRRGDHATAAAVRDFRADFLGERWPWHARRAWIDSGLIFRALAWLAFLLAAAGAWWLVHRYVVYPYLLYTRDYYRTEFRHRHRQRRDAARPFTGEEIRDYMETRGTL